MLGEGEVKFIIGNSLIHGQGVIAQTLIKQGEIIGVAVHLTTGGPAVTAYLGRYVNHSYKPNSCLVLKESQYNLVAITDIKPGEEIAADYNFTPSFLARPEDNFK